MGLAAGLRRSSYQAVSSVIPFELFGHKQLLEQPKGRPSGAFTKRRRSGTMDVSSRCRTLCSIQLWLALRAGHQLSFLTKIIDPLDHMRFRNRLSISISLFDNLA
jgi:hypothetical protein